MKKINGHFLKGTVKRVCGALAIAAALAVTPVIFDGCQNQTGTEQSGQKEYDANGWNKNDPTDLINGLTGTQYDQAGYDRAGYNQAGYDKEGYNKAGYNQYGWNKGGQNENGTNYDNNGFNIDGTQHKDTGTPYAPDGYDREGYDTAGWHKDPGNLINKFTNTIYNVEGYNRAGYNQYGWNKDGQNENGTNYDANGFKMDGTYQETGSPYDANGYKVDGYNDAGWHRDLTNLINKFTNTEYDLLGVDRDGYNMAGWNTVDASDPVNKNGTLYDANGYDRAGHQQPDPSIVIPTYGDMNVELGTVYGGFSQYNIKTAYTTSDSQHINDIGSLLMGNWFPQLKTQAENLNLGYTKAANKYPAYGSQFSGIAAGENQTMVNIMINGGNVTGIVNSIFGADTTNKDKFNAELAAYQQGHYIDKKQRVDNSHGGNPETRLQMTGTLKNLLSGLGLIAQVNEDTYGITNESLTAILEELKGRLLTGLNNATGVGITPAITGDDQTKIRALNAHLLQQIGDDRGELRALIDDIKNIGMTDFNIESGSNYFDNQYTMGPQKAGQLNNDFNFNLEFLKPTNGKDTDIQMA